MRNNQKLSLRKKAVNQKIMEHRKINEENRTLNYIDSRKLNLIPFQEDIQKLLCLKTGQDKILYMTTYLENNVEVIDIFNNGLYYGNNNNNEKMLTDLDKFFLLYILAILDKSVMKEYFPEKLIKENNFIFSKDNPLILSQKLFQIYFSILFNYKMEDVQITIISLLLNYSQYSNDFINYCLNDIKYISKLFEITYTNNINVVSEVGIILDNIIINENCDEDKLNEILKSIPIIKRCHELIYTVNFVNNVKKCYLDLLLSLVQQIDQEDYNRYFIDFIYVFSNILSTSSMDEDLYNLIIKITVKLSISEKICEKIMTTGLGYIFYNSLSKPKLEKEYIQKILQIFSNLFYLDDIAEHYLKYDNGKFISILIKIINTCLHSRNEKDISLLKEVLFVLSNLAAGSQEVQTKISKSEIPSLVIQIMKIKTDNDIYFEGIHFFNNIITDCNKETFATISELHPFKLFAKGLENTGIRDNYELCLNAILNLIQKNNEVYHTLENLKNDFYICGAKRKIDDLCLCSEKEIANKAISIINCFDDKMKTD